MAFFDVEGCARSANDHTLRQLTSVSDIIAAATSTAAPPSPKQQVQAADPEVLQQAIM
jgi:hypothetical protein